MRYEEKNNKVHFGYQYYLLIHGETGLMGVFMKKLESDLTLSVKQKDQH